MRADWDWLLERVEEGSLPDMPCRWVNVAEPDGAIIYWLDPDARTRHVIVGYGSHVLMGSVAVRPVQSRMI